MIIRKGTEADLNEIMLIYHYARIFMAENGNPTQWGMARPQRWLVLNDMNEGKTHVCVDENSGKILCTFYFAVEPEPTYTEIDGKWLNNRPYGVIHRIASAPGTHGAATFCINSMYERCGNVRIDTHDNNRPMRNLLDKLGFTFCGIITEPDGTQRRAYQKG